MCVAIALTAARMGAAVSNHTECIEILKRVDEQTGKEVVAGARCRDRFTSKMIFKFSIEASHPNACYAHALLTMSQIHTFILMSYKNINF